MRGIIRGHQWPSAAIIHLFEAHARDTARACGQSGNHHNPARRQVISANQCQSVPIIHTSRAGGQSGNHHNPARRLRRVGIDGESRACVEAIPPEPQDKSAKHLHAIGGVIRESKDKGAEHLQHVRMAWHRYGLIRGNKG